VNVVVVSVPEERSPNGEIVDPYQLRLMASALAIRGWSCTHRLYDRRLVDSLRQALPDVVFNLAYGYVDPTDGAVFDQPVVAADLERLGVPITGSESAAQAIAQDKVETCATVERVGVRVPERFDFDTWPEDAPMAVRKPRFGAFQRDVTLVRRSDRTSVPPLRSDEILQRYLDGPEYTVSVLEDADSARPMALHPLRLIFPEVTTEPRVIERNGQDWRWVLTEERLPALESTAIDCFQALGLRDYARLDFRVVDGEGFLLDANALPGLHPATGLFSLSALGSGIPYHHLIWRLIDLKRAVSNAAA
jgi:D-alanine-D-alanine ligase